MPLLSLLISISNFGFIYASVYTALLNNCGLLQKFEPSKLHFFQISSLQLLSLFLQIYITGTWALLNSITHEYKPVIRHNHKLLEVTKLNAPRFWLNNRRFKLTIPKEIGTNFKKLNAPLFWLNNRRFKLTIPKETGTIFVDATFHFFSIKILEISYSFFQVFF